jgi:hypothetical protein
MEPILLRLVILLLVAAGVVDITVAILLEQVRPPADLEVVGVDGITVNPEMQVLAELLVKVTQVELVSMPVAIGLWNWVAVEVALEDRAQMHADIVLTRVAVLEDRVLSQ